MKREDGTKQERKRTDKETRIGKIVIQEKI